MLLKYNVANIKHERRLLNIEEEYTTVYMQGSGESAIVEFKTNVEHKLNVGDYVFFIDSSSDNTSIHDKFRVLPDDFSTISFRVEIPRFKPIYITGMNDGESISIIETSYGIPFPVEKGRPFILLRRYWSYKEVSVENEELINYATVYSSPTEYIGFEYVKNEYNGLFYQWQMGYEKIDCVHISEKYFEAPIGQVLSNEEYLIEDERFVTNDGVFRTGMNVYEYLEMINISLPLSTSFSNNLQYEEATQALFEEKRDSLIPDITDYEKRCFSPYYKNDSSIVKPINSIVFNLYFRDRSDSTNWTTHDLMGWNQCKMKGVKFTPNEVLTNGDLLSNLNFTDEDVYYRKKKISKSFLRLSFYDSMDPMKQMLLYYSTIFLDSADLYGKYINNIEKKIAENKLNPLFSLVNDNSLGEDNLTVSFKVVSKYNRMASSEGFYLYLFPDGISDRFDRTIYMKAEFNHAGYGTTIPLIYPNNGSTPLTFENEAFPLSLIDLEDGDLLEYYRQLYIPVKIRYDKTVNDFIYYFPISKRQNGGTLLFDLYEPKINPIDGEELNIVIKPTSDKLTIEPSSCVIDMGAEKQLNAILTNKDGKRTNVNRNAAWKASNNNVSVNNDGLIRSNYEGTTNITATYNGLTGTCVVTVMDEDKVYNIYVDSRGDITQDSDVHSLPCDIYVDVTWIGSVYYDDNYDGDDDRREQTGGTDVNLFKAGATKLLRTATATGGNNFNSWVELEAITGPKTYDFTYNNNNYKITWK